MTKNIRTVLTPLLIISYVSGFRIIEFRFICFLYILLFWSLYFVTLKFTIIFYFINERYDIEYFISIGLDILITFLSIAFGIYYDKKFKNCLKKLDIIDNTLTNIGITTDYHKLQKKTKYYILGWFLMVITMSYGGGYWLTNEYKQHDVLSIMFAFLIRNYCSYLNIINDLIIATIFGYIGLKFDQINEYILNLTNGNNLRIKRAWENSTHQHRFSHRLEALNEFVIYTIIHLHLELRKICWEIDSIFGVQITFKMGCNFCWLALDLTEVFRAILINDYIKTNKILFIIIMLIWFCQNIFKLFFVNYVCETVSVKANTTGSLINKISYSTCDVKIRQHISQLLLQMTQAPVKFYGIGLFQYGYKFLHGCCSTIVTVVVLLIQAYINKHIF